MIEVDPKRRIQISEILSHPWVIIKDAAIQSTDGTLSPPQSPVLNFAPDRMELKNVSRDIEAFLVRLFGTYDVRCCYDEP